MFYNILLYNKIQDFLPLKAGVCIMALGAMAQHNI